MISQQKKSKTLHIALWIVQALVALVFIGTGLFKSVTPIPTLAGMWPWAGEYPNLLRLTGVIDLCGGIGIVLPALTRIKPELTVLAALGCAVLLMCAIGFHLSRGEAANTPFNLVMLALVLFVFWGRRMKAPINPRGKAGSLA
ncbi:DoxX family protein [Spirosoma flavum]|uniref:DoxX family protein n=1 Tax=Spirosoma flavum TaxID=2048557 RepID=A0ABW6AHC0_9BACT